VPTAEFSRISLEIVINQAEHRPLLGLAVRRIADYPRRFGAEK
jgi:hypothetical protein